MSVRMKDQVVFPKATVRFPTPGPQSYGVQQEPVEAPQEEVRTKVVEAPEKPEPKGTEGAETAEHHRRRKS